MKVSAQELRLHDPGTHGLGFLAAALGAFAIATANCNGATPTQATTEPIWPTKEWQMSIPEVEGMDSKELAKLVDFGTVHRFDSLLVARHGKVVAEACYAPYSACLGSMILKAFQMGVGHSTWCLATWRRLATCTYARACGKVNNCFRPLGSIR
jgi:hypothetical protein